MTERTYAAIDLGAESGRVVRGRLEDGQVSLWVAHRFANQPVRLPDGLHWDILQLFAEALDGLGKAAASGALEGVAVDAWGVDYALLDESGVMLAPPFHYRDSRTEGTVERAHARVPREEMYAITGIQTMPINTVFQLLAEKDAPALANARRIALVPDLLAYWLSGELANEVTIASTTGLLDARTGEWATPLVESLGLPSAPFGETPIEAGTRLGRVLAEHDDAVGGAAGAPVYAVAGHDTASAFVAAPVRTPEAAVLSSGTWSLLGLELAEPILSPEACAYNLTNERGVDGTIRLLRNVMGLWLLQECRRQWAGSGGPRDYDELNRLAARAAGEVALFDPDDERFLRPGDMPARIAQACARAGQRAPQEPGEVVRSVLVSLACKYRLVLERLQRVTDRRIEVVHAIGGGARNELLCRLTADVVGLPVLAGPVEATALGNVLMQARAAGELGSLAELREVAAASADPVVYEPGDARDEADSTYERFLSVTGLAVNTPEAAIA